MRQRLVNFLVTTLVVLVDLKDFLVSASFIPFFGIYGTDALSAGGTSGGTFLSSIRYSVWQRMLVVNIQKGKTMFTYTVLGVHPLSYRRLRAAPTAEAFETAFRANGAYVIETVWRYTQGGSFRNDSQRARKLRKTPKHQRVRQIGPGLSRTATY